MDEDWKPVDLSEVQEKLGDASQVFMPDPFRIGIGICASLIIWALGLAYAHQLVVAPDRLFNLLCSVAFPLVGSFMLRWLIRIIGLKILIYPQGFIFARRNKVVVFPWASITHIQERTDGTVVIVRSDGEAISYSRDTIQAAASLTQIIKKSTVGRAYRVPAGAEQEQPRPDWSSQRFADCFRRAMHSAEHWAKEMHTDYVGTEHILLGLIEGDSGPVVDLCKHSAIEPAAIRSAIAETLIPAPEDVALSSRPLTPMAWEVTSYAVEESQQLGQQVVTAKHLFLGLLRCEESVAGQALLSLDVDLDEARKLAVHSPLDRG